MRPETTPISEKVVRINVQFDFSRLLYCSMPVWRQLPKMVLEWNTAWQATSMNRILRQSQNAFDYVTGCIMNAELWIHKNNYQPSTLILDANILSSVYAVMNQIRPH